MRRRNPERKVRKICYQEDDQTEAAGIPESAAIVKTPTPRKRIKGKLSLLPTLSIDILFEIFIYLQPLDVLNIMYTSRAFRSLLIAPSSTFIWKAVRLNVEEFPDLPDDLSEVQYAKLAFGPHCHKCGKKTKNGAFWEVRARFCNACMKLELVPADKCTDSIEQRRSYKKVLGVVELDCDGRYKRKYTLNISFLGINFRAYHFCKRHVKRLNSHVGTSYPYNLDADAWLASTERRLTQVKDHAKKCAEWQAEIYVRQYELNEQIKTKRTEDIIQRLSDLDISMDEDQLGAFEDHPLVRTAVPLTDRIWNNIKVSLLEWFHEQDAIRLARLALKTYKREHRETLLPCIQDFLEIAEVRAVLKSPHTVPLSQASFGDMEALMKNWRKNASLQLASLLKPANRTNGKCESDEARLKKLRLATTVFSCSSCSITSYNPKHPFDTHAVHMHYPWVMAHPCVRNDDCIWGEESAKLWDPSVLRHEVKIGHTIVKPILDACDLSPQTTTSAEMDALNARFICVNCKDGELASLELEDFIVVYTWRTAMVHALDCQYNGKGNTWERLSEADTRFGRVADSKREEAGIHQWGCTLCRGLDVEQSPMTVSAVTSHIASQHRGEENPAGQYYRLARFPPGMFEKFLHIEEGDDK
ncbi:hypothetical protein BD410DRAFT_899308 [Rickenella mellea]|uniref:F-box domain-containing protein n=1 Tax=Rickenella mellea TaxID=50990 RepID=A0A4Y7Q1S9_9AGAM|nr:hypothetical protein BD410DRAFT_899308 [Rickenella mellea]